MGVGGCLICLTGVRLEGVYVCRQGGRGVCTCVVFYACVRARARAYVYVCVCVCVCVEGGVSVPVYTHVFACVYVCVRERAHSCVYVFVRPIVRARVCFLFFCFFECVCVRACACVRERYQTLLTMTLSRVCRALAHEVTTDT